MIREISTVIVALIAIAFITYFILPALFAGYNALNSLGVLPNNTAYNTLNSFISFIMNNLHWIIIAFTIVLFFVYISTRGNIGIGE